MRHTATAIALTLLSRFRDQAFSDKKGQQLSSRTELEINR